MRIRRIYECEETNIRARHLVQVPPGTHLLSDAIINSPILAADRGILVDEAMGEAGPSGTTGGGGQDFEFGVDPSLDPELAMVDVVPAILRQTTHDIKPGATLVHARRASTPGSC